MNLHKRVAPHHAGPPDYLGFYYGGQTEPCNAPAGCHADMTRNYPDHYFDCFNHGYDEGTDAYSCECGCPNDTDHNRAVMFRNTDNHGHGTGDFVCPSCQEGRHHWWLQ